MTTLILINNQGNETKIASFKNYQDAFTCGCALQSRNNSEIVYAIDYKINGVAKRQHIADNDFINSCDYLNNACKERLRMKFAAIQFIS